MGRWVLLAMTLVVVVSVALLRRRPLPALVLLLAGSAAAKVAAPGSIAALLPFLLVLPAGIEVCFIAATRPRRTSITAAVVALGVLAGYAAVPAPPRLNLKAGS